MSRKRLVVSLADDDLTGRLTNSNGQILFTLTPVEVSGLFETAHPIVWEIFDLSFGQPAMFEYASNIAVATTFKTSEACVQPQLYRVVPPGHYTALTRWSNMPVWCETRRWHKEVPDSIVITNDSQTDQAFAICALTVEKGSYEPRVSPVVLYNKIKHERHLLVKTRMILQGYFGQGYKPMKQLHKKDDLPRIQDDNGREWSMELDDSVPAVSSWTIYQRSDGRVCIRQGDSDGLSTAKETLGKDIQDVKNKLSEFQKLVTQSMGTDFMAISNLRKKVVEIEKRASTLQEQLGDTNIHVSMLQPSVEDLQSKVESCVRDIEHLRSLPTPNSQPLTSTIGSVRSSVDNVTRLHESITKIETKLNDLDENVQRTVPQLQNDVTRLDQDMTAARNDITSIDHDLGTLAANEKWTESEIVKAEKYSLQLSAQIIAHMDEIEKLKESMKSTGTAVVEAGKKADEAGQGVEEVMKRMEKADQEKNQVEQSLKTLSTQVKMKAGSDEFSKLSSVFRKVAEKVRGVEGAAVGLQDKVTLLSTRMDRVDGSIGEIKGTVGQQTARIESVANSAKNSEGEVKEVTRKIQQVELTVEKMGAENANLEGTVDGMRIQGREDTQKLREQVNKVDNLTRDVHQRAGTLEGSVHKLTGRSGALEQKVNRLEGDMQTVQGGLQGVKKDVNTVVQEVKNVAGAKVWHKKLWGL